MARWLGGLCLVFLVWPNAALAHSSVEGFEGFYAGFLHPLKETAQGLAIAALGLFVAQHPPQQVERATLFFFVTLMLGLIAAFLFPNLIVPGPLYFSLAAVLGVLVSIAKPLGWLVLLSLASITGFTSGITSMPEPGSFSAMAFTIAGSIVGAIFIILYALGGAHWMLSQTKRPWLAIGLRVIGSWVVAACALMLALAFRT